MHRNCIHCKWLNKWYYGFFIRFSSRILCSLSHSQSCCRSRAQFPDKCPQPEWWWHIENHWRYLSAATVSVGACSYHEIAYDFINPIILPLFIGRRRFFFVAQYQLNRRSRTFFQRQLNINEKNSSYFQYKLLTIVTFLSLSFFCPCRLFFLPLCAVYLVHFCVNINNG